MSQWVDGDNPIATFPKYRIWAVVGVSSDRNKFGNKIYRDLREAGYQVYGIHPKLTEIEGDTCYSSLEVLPVRPDVVDIVVPPQIATNIVEDCIRLGIKRIWFQPGSESEEALEKARNSGISVVSDACILIQRQVWPS